MTTGNAAAAAAALWQELESSPNDTAALVLADLLEDDDPDTAIALSWHVAVQWWPEEDHRKLPALSNSLRCRGAIISSRPDLARRSRLKNRKPGHLPYE